MSTTLSGFRAWLVQRLTAVLLVVGSAMLLLLLSFPPASDYAEWRSWLEQPFPVISILLFGLALLVHAWVGVRDVIIDYLHSVALRLIALSLLAVYLLGCLFWLLWILVK